MEEEAPTPRGGQGGEAGPGERVRCDQVVP